MGEHLEFLRLRGYSAATIYGRRRALIRAQSALGVPLLDADEAMLLEWRRSLTVSAEVIVHEVCHLREFYAWALERGRVTGNPAAALPVPRTGRRLPRPISEPDLMLALDSAPPRIRPWLVLAGWCGLRACEIAGLRRESVMETVRPPVLIVADRATKGHGERVVPLTAFVIGELRLAGLPSSGYVFRRRDGQAGPCPPGLISHYANIHLHECGVDATLHQLRHRCATMAYRASRDLRAVQVLMGHARPDTTAGYAAFDQPSVAAAVAGIPVPGRLRKVAG